MANESPTTDRLHFASAGAVRRSSPKAIVTPLDAAHVAMIGALAALKPHRIVGNADAADLTEVADHVRGVLAAVGAYVNVIATDAPDRGTVGRVDRRYVAGMLGDTASDIVAHVTRAAIDHEAA
jgi:hypothetical protein